MAFGLAAGCASVRREEPDTQKAPAAAEANVAAAAQAALPASLPPPEGYAWEDLARLAAANCREAKALLFEAEAERYQTAVDTGWRNPQLRVGEHWGDEDEVTPGRSGMRTYPDEVNMPSRPFTRYRESSDREFDGKTAGLRVYTANPFVNRWLRKGGAASAQAKEAESKEVAYAVYCEVRSLCLEAEMLREEIGLLEQMAVLREQTCEIRREQSEAGVVNALELIREETRLATLRSEMREKCVERRQLVRRIATLAGIPAEQVRLRPPDFSRQAAVDRLDAATLTELAFVRRPDLARAQREKEEAEFGVRAARAGQIPWFEYVEGTYEDEEARVRSYEQHFTGYDRSTSDEAEWQIRVAVTVPVFNWLGDEIRLSRAQLMAAETLVQGLYDDIRREVGGVLEDYRIVRSERDRFAAESAALRAKMTQQIDALADEPTVRREDVLRAREELFSYLRVCLKVDRESLRLEQYLETVSGGPLTEMP